MNQSEKISFSVERRRRIALNVVGSIVGLLAILIFLNILGMRHFIRLHLDSRDSSELSPMTTEALKKLERDVKVILLFEKELPLYSSIDNLLREYENASPRISVERVDYTREPQRAENIKKRYQLILPELKEKTYFRNLVIFDIPGRTPRVIYEKEFSDFNVNNYVSGKESEIKRVTFKGEMLFTGALVSLLESSQKIAYFSEGHREHSLKDDNVNSGYSKFAEILKQSNIEVKGLSIWSEKEIPADCSLLIVGGPQDLLTEDEITKIDNYLSRGGSLLVLMPQLGKTGLEPLMKDWGIDVKDQLVYDPVSHWNYNPVVTNFNSQSPISRPLFGSMLLLPLCREVSKSSTAIRGPDAPQVVELFRSSTSGMGVSLNQKGEVVTEEGEQPAELSMAASVEKGALAGVRFGRGTTRIVVIGNSRFFDNRWLDATPANRDFTVLALNWLLDRTQLMGGVGPKAILEYQLSMSQAQLHLLVLIMILIVPGCVMGLGMIVWFWRRN